MIEELIKYLTNKKILILGFGMEGISTYNFIRKYLKEQKIFIADKNEQFLAKNSFIEKDLNVEIICGDKYLENLNSYDIIMKAPGISFANIDITSFESKIKSQVELLLELTKNMTIGITGTKGKSTTSSLIYKMISDQGKECMLLGNIGVPVFDYIDRIKDDTILVLELSSHQLEFVDISPKIAIILNIFEEHLDHYKSLENYIDAKANIFKFQKSDDYFIYNSDNLKLGQALKSYDIHSKTIEISYNNKPQNIQDAVVKIENDIIQNGKKLYDGNTKRKLLGNHNLNNIMFVLGVSQLLKLDLTKTIQSINDFEPLPHRMEFVGEFNDILYYNDSIATIPESAINTIETLKNVDTLILGGMDRKIDLTKFIKYLDNSNIKNLICLPTTGHIIADEITNLNKKIYKVQDMVEAVKIAKTCTEKNKICLLSPAAASYGYYKNFKERGNEFKKLVMN